MPQLRQTGRIWGICFYIKAVEFIFLYPINRGVYGGPDEAPQTGAFAGTPINPIKRGGLRGTPMYNPTKRGRFAGTPINPMKQGRFTGTSIYNPTKQGLL